MSRIYLAPCITDQKVQWQIFSCPTNSYYLPNPVQKYSDCSKTVTSIQKSRFHTYGVINSTRGSVLRLKCKRRQFVSPCTAAQGFSPGLSADGSLIYSRGGPLRKQPAPVEASSCFVPFSTLLVLNQEYYQAEGLKRRLLESIILRAKIEFSTVA